MGTKMASVAPILASEPTAAKLLDLKVNEFRALVKGGVLPKGREIAPGLVRWPVDDLRRIASGEAGGGYEW
jgi:hypothetical protein